MVSHLIYLPYPPFILLISKALQSSRNASETSKYGSRGASGVIEVKTKRGNGSKFQIYYDGTAGFDVVYKRLRMLNAAEYVSAAKALGLDYVDKG